MKLFNRQCWLWFYKSAYNFVCN